MGINKCNLFSHRAYLSNTDVINIRRNLNPKKAFAPGVTHEIVRYASYAEIVDIFDRRVSKWYFDAANSFKTKLSDYNFPIAIFCCVIIDLLSQHIFGRPRSSEKIFKAFCQKYLKKYNHKIVPPIKSCKFENGKWIKVEVQEVADALYHGFRCGLVHSGRVYEYGRINENFPSEIIKIEPWGKDKDKTREINVHTTGLLSILEKVFRQYIEDLKANQQPLKRNFIKKMHFEYGLDLSIKKIIVDE